VNKSICYFVIDEGSTADEKLAAVKRAGYDGVELTFGPDPADLLALQMDEAAVHGVRARVERHGLQVSGVLSGVALRTTPLLHNEASVRVQGVHNLEQALQRAHWLGVDAMLVHPGQLLAGMQYDQAWDWVVTALRSLIPACEASGVAIGLENVWNKFLLSPREMRQLLDEVHHPLIGCYLDVANMLLYGYAEQWVTIVGQHINRVHFKDFKRERGGGRFCQLLEGDCNYPEVMRGLRALGYASWYTSEVSSSERGPSQTMADTAVRMDTILAMGA
jgi:hexulose-6-phosphate isomerase